MIDPGRAAGSPGLAARLVPWLTRFPEVWVALVPVVYTLATLAPPVLHATGFDGAADGLFWFFRYFCHQLPHRTLFVFGHPMAVCARCFGIAASLGIVALLAGRLWAIGFRRVRAPLVLVGLAAVPMALDGFTQIFGFRESTNTLRVLTGVLLGGMTSLWTVPMVCAAFEEMREEPHG